jgi:hypothetical protein
VTIASVLVFMKESFRKDRSSTYQDALATRTQKIARRQSQAIGHSSREEGASHPSSRDKITVYPTDLRVATSLKRVLKKRNNVVLLIATGKSGRIPKRTFPGLCDRNRLTVLFRAELWVHLLYLLHLYSVSLRQIPSECAQDRVGATCLRTRSVGQVFR